jgi:hypothetical protein
VFLCSSKFFYLFTVASPLDQLRMSYYHQRKPRDCKGNIRQIERVGHGFLMSWVWHLTYPTLWHCFRFVLNFSSRRCLISCCVSFLCLFPIPLFEASRIKVDRQQWIWTSSSSKFFIGIFSTTSSASHDPLHYSSLVGSKLQSSSPWCINEIWKVIIS